MVGVLFYVIFFVNVVLLFFHFAERFLFRAARDVSGVRSSPPWARVVIKLKMSFQALSHSPSHDRAKALTSPPPDFLFSFIHQNPSHPSHHPTIPPNSKIAVNERAVAAMHLAWVQIAEFSKYFSIFAHYYSLYLIIIL